MAKEEIAKNEEPFVTLEIYLAAYLSIKGFKVTVMPPDEKGKVYFSFKRNTHGFFTILNEYNNKDTQVPLVDFVRETKYLRGLMHQHKFGEADNG